jgi:hypothetical protein
MTAPTHTETPAVAGDDYPVGSIKHHPDWPKRYTIAQRQPFEDGNESGCSSWLAMTPGAGTRWMTKEQVAGWPDLKIVDLEAAPAGKKKDSSTSQP